MENINSWLGKLKTENSAWGDTIDKIMEGLSERGFDSKILNRWVDEELSRIKTEYEEKFIKDVNDETQEDTN